MARLGDLCLTTCIMLNKEVVKETPLLLAVASHQEAVVKRMLELKVRGGGSRRRRCCWRGAASLSVAYRYI